MNLKKLKNYSDFLSQIEYPAVVFFDDGEVLSVNDAAVAIIGNKAGSITMEPDKFMSSDEFWPTLEQKKSIIWHRITLKVNDKDSYVVSGFINSFEYDERKGYIVFFELRSDVRIGSMSLERIVDHIGVVALYLYKPQGKWVTRYVSKNISEYGYTDADFYQENISLQDLLVKTDHDILIGNLYKCYNTGISDFDMKVRVVSSGGDINKTNLKVHVVSTENGDVDGVEFLFIKNDEPEYTNEQNSYIMSIMTKVKSFAMVERIDRDGELTVRYITPNSKSVGINGEAILKGNKLITDYIFPKDRKFVIDKTKEAIKKGFSDYEDEFRIVDDNGNARWVKAQNSITQAEDSSYSIEVFVTDISEKKRLQDSVIEAKKEYENKLSYIMNNDNSVEDSVASLIDRDTWSELVKSFSDISGLYSTIIGIDGKQLTTPYGPPDNIGFFYDLFEKPAYKDIYMELNDIVSKNNVPLMMEMNDGINESRICGAPIKVGGRHIATWIVCAYDNEGAEKMQSIMESHWNLALMFSEFVYNNKIVAKEATRSKYVEMQLEEKVKRQKILAEALAVMDVDDNSTIDSIMSQTGEYLDTDVMVLYSKSDESFECSHLWSKDHNMSAEEYLNYWKNGNTGIQKSMDKNDVLVVDASHPNKLFQKALEKAGIKSFVALPVEIESMISGCLVLANTTKTDPWRDDAIEFIQDIRNVIQGMLTKIEGDGNIRAVNSLLVDTYNYLKVGIFIKDDATGEVLFSNQPLNEKLGYNFVGRDSKLLVREVNDGYRGVGIVNRPFMTERKENSWRSYLKQFDKIMDLTEVSMKWLDGRKASLVILRDVQD